MPSKEHHGCRWKVEFTSFQCRRAATWRLPPHITPQSTGMNFSWVPLRACRGWSSPKTEWETLDRQSRNTPFKTPSGSSTSPQVLSKSQGSAFLWGLALPTRTMGVTVKDGNRGNPSRQSSRDTSYIACLRIHPRIKLNIAIDRRDPNAP